MKKYISCKDIKPGMEFTYPDAWVFSINEEKRGTNWVVVDKATYSPATGVISNNIDNHYWCQRIGKDGIACGEMILCFFDKIMVRSKFKWRKHKPKYREFFNKKSWNKTYRIWQKCNR